jgi:cold shock CspA family protein
LSKQYVVNPQATIKVGLIKRLVRNYAGYLYGFITPKDGSKDIYFGENETHPSLISLLTEGYEVKAEVEQSARGPRARRVWKSEGDKPDDV